MLRPVDRRDVIYTKTRLRTHLTDQSSRRPPHREWLKDIVERCAIYVGCPGRPPINASVWSGGTYELTGLQRNGSRSSFSDECRFNLSSDDKRVHVRVSRVECLNNPFAL
ncbi:hypothetical protein TNCV_4102251 [Trichonephila clavipes]|nr:hypothetical protein TNCV_4102251 [Trichonephila clavipes]